MIRVLRQRLAARTPLGWRQLQHNPARLAVAVGGVVVANLLIFMQLGVMGALFESAVAPVRLLRADILLLSPEAKVLNQLGTLPRRRLYQALGVDGVRDGAALHVGNVEIRNQTTGDQASVTVFGIDPGFDGFTRPEITDRLPGLRLADTALLDRLGRSGTAPLVAATASGAVAEAELSGRTVRIGGLFRLGGSFQSDSNLIVGDQTFLRLFPRSMAAAPSAMLLQVAPGADPATVAARLRALLPVGDTRVMTAEEYIAFVQGYMAANTPIGVVFSFGVAIGFVIGFAIVYQILSADVADHLGEYATLKAMGYTQGWLLAVVFEQALLLSAFGFVPGLTLSIGLYALIGAASELAVEMTLGRASLVFTLTVVMCVLSGAMATRRLHAADPADVY